MSGLGTGAALAPIRFQRNISFLSGAGSAGIALNATGPVLAALSSETAPFPPGDIELGQINVQAETPQPIEFGKGNAKVSFTASGSAFAGLGVFQDSAKVLAKIAPDETILPGVELGDGTDRNFVLLRWGFDAKANASGSMALGPAASASLAVEGASEGMFAVVRSLDRTLPARKTLQSVVDSWMLPRQVRDASQLDPGTWLISEVQAGVGVKLGVQAGYKFNWVREAKLNGLQGDIGLRIDAAIAANIGFRAEGRWAVVVAREDADPVLRVRLFRLKSRQLGLAVNASAVFKPVTTILPPKADDLIKAVFGTHGAQVLGYIAVVEKWTDKDTKLTALLAAEGVDQAKRLIAHVANVPEDELDDRFEEVRGRVVKLIEAWRDLDHRVAATIMKFVEERVDLTDVRGILTELQTIDGEGLKNLLIRRLNASDFLITPAGKLLESMAGKSLLALLNSPLERVHGLATKALKLLDGSVVEETLGRFQEYIESQFNIGTIMNAITETDFNKLDGLLKQKLAEFLGETGIDFAKLDEARAAIRMVLDKRQEWYNAALRALERTYNAELVATYQKTVQNTAHFDIRFDFRNDPQGVASLLEATLAGDFDRVLTTQHRDVTLGLGQLAHGVTRRSTVELTLPFFHFTGTHLNQALATVEAIDDGGRVLVYTLEAQDVAATNHRNSTLAVAMSLASQGGQLRVHEGSGFDYNYTLRQAGKRVTTQELGAQLTPILEHFPDGPPLAALLNLIDRRTEEAIPNTPDFLGNLLTDLRVNFSADDARVIGDVWMRARPDKVGAYEPMSIAIQTALRRAIANCYFQDRDRYADSDVAQILLCWACMPPANQVLADGKTRPTKPDRIIWDVASNDLRRTRLQLNETAFLLDRRLQAIHERLRNTAGMQGVAGRYHPDENGKIRKRLVDKPDEIRFAGLLLGEGALVDEAWEAGKAMSEFLQAQANQPSLAIKRLEQFGSRITSAFNKTAGGVFLGGVSRALGTLVFIEATQALAGAPLGIRQNAVLSINAMKGDFTFDPKQFLENGQIPADQIAVREQLVAIG